MSLKHISLHGYFLLLTILLPFERVQGQWYITNDSLPQHNIDASDTLTQDIPQFYKNIQEDAKHSWSKTLLNALLDDSQKNVDSGEKMPINQSYLPFKGKIIHEIKIIVLDPFGTDINHPDSLIQQNYWQRAGNKLHASTKSYIISQNLQFKKGDIVKPAQVEESETYLRNTGYIQDARIWMDSIPNTNEVNVLVAVRDVFPIGVEIHSLSGTSVDVELTDKNFLGIGNELGIEGIYKTKYADHWGYGIHYAYKNILQTFTNLNVSYLDNIAQKQFNFSAERPLLSSFSLFGEAGYMRTFGRPEVAGWDSITPDYIDQLSVSFGKAFDLPCDYSTRRIVLAAHYEQKFPSYRKVALSNNRQTPYQYAQNRLWLFQASIYQQAYYREYLVNNFGITEDIAHGYNFSAQIGYNQFTQYEDGMYASLSAAGSHEFKTGNYYANASVSSFFNDQHAYEGILKLHVRYYTLLSKWGENRFRQFVNINYAKLLNPIPFFDNTIYFSQLTNLHTNAFRDEAKGNERLVINLENDWFSSWNLIGFRFVFFNFVDLGWIAPDNNLFDSSNFCWGIGLGVRIRNELLAFKTINIKIGFYPRFQQQNTIDFLEIGTSYPKVSPNFIPGYPQEIPLD